MSVIYFKNNVLVKNPEITKMRDGGQEQQQLSTTFFFAIFDDFFLNETMWHFSNSLIGHVVFHHRGSHWTVHTGQATFRQVLLTPPPPHPPGARYIICVSIN